MPRSKSTTPTHECKVYLDEDVFVKMQLALYSEALGRIPYGAQSRLINDALRAYFDKQKEAPCTPPNKIPDSSN